MTPAAHTLDDVDRRLLEQIRLRFPVDHRPFQILGEKVGLSEQACVERIDRLKAAQVISAICAVFDARALGYQVMELAMKVDPARVDDSARIVSQDARVSRVEALNDSFNLWVTVAVPPAESLEQAVGVLHALAGAEETIALPTVRLYKAGAKHGATDAGSWPDQPEEVFAEPQRGVPRPALTEADIRFIRIAQDDLPLLELPFAVWAEQAESTEEELFAWVRRAEHLGYLRGFAALLSPPEPMRLTDAMVVWQVPPQEVDAVGEEAARFREVIRCYCRPVFPNWPYALFTVIRAPTSAACMDVAKRIEERVGRLPHKHLVLTREYKRTHLKLV
jgi:DNA-binding Lrp family transcriptional regulator